MYLTGHIRLYCFRYFVESVIFQILIIISKKMFKDSYIGKEVPWLSCL